MTIQLSSKPIDAGNPWTFTVLLTVPAGQTPQSALAFLTKKYAGPSVTMEPLSGYITFPLTGTSTANQFSGTGTLSATETSRLLKDSGNTLLGVNYETVQLSLTSYEGTTTPNPQTNSGKTFHSEDILVSPAVAKGDGLVPAVV